MHRTRVIHVDHERRVSRVRLIIVSLVKHVVIRITLGQVTRAALSGHVTRQSRLALLPGLVELGRRVEDAAEHVHGEAGDVERVELDPAEGEEPEEGEADGLGDADEGGGEGGADGGAEELRVGEHAAPGDEEAVDQEEA